MPNSPNIIDHNFYDNRGVEINHPEDCISHHDKGWFAASGMGFCSTCITGLDEVDDISSWAAAEDVYCENCDQPVAIANDRNRKE